MRMVEKAIACEKFLVAEVGYHYHTLQTFLCQPLFPYALTTKVILSYLIAYTLMCIRLTKTRYKRYMNPASLRNLIVVVWIATAAYNALNALPKLKSWMNYHVARKGISWLKIKMVGDRVHYEGIQLT